MEQVRMAPISTLAFVVGKTAPYLVLSQVGALVIVVAAMVFFDLPMRGIWMALSIVIVRVSGRRSGHGPAGLDHRGDAAGRVSGRRADRVAADVHPLGLHLPDRQHADRAAVHLRRSCRRATS